MERDKRIYTKVQIKRSLNCDRLWHVRTQWKGGVWTGFGTSWNILQDLDGKFIIYDNIEKPIVAFECFESCMRWVEKRTECKISL